MELWFSEFHSKGAKMSIRVDRQLYSGQSEFQRIEPKLATVIKILKAFEK